MNERHTPTSVAPDLPYPTSVAPDLIRGRVRRGGSDGPGVRG